MNALAILAALLAVAGTIVMTVGTLVILRSDRDRNLGLHAASLMQAAGVPLILGAALAVRDGDLIARAFVVAAFTLLTAPLTTHALARLSLDKRRRGDSLAQSEHGDSEVGFAGDDARADRSRGGSMD